MAQQKGYVKTFNLNGETKQQVKPKRSMNHKELTNDLDCVWLGLEEHQKRLIELTERLDILSKSVSTLKEILSINNSRLSRLSRIHPKRESVY